MANQSCKDNQTRIEKEIKESENNLKEIFDKFDKDGNGSISKDEFKLALSEMGVEMTDSDLDKMFKNVDFNKDGKIVFSEFKRMIEDRG